MPIVVECPNGHRSFTKEEHAGKRVACPVCRAVVRVPVPDERIRPRPVEPVPTVEPADARSDDSDPELEHRPRKKKGRSRRAALDRVHRGLGFHYAKQILLLIGLLLNLLRMIFLGPRLTGLVEGQDEGAVKSFLFAALGIVLLLVLVVRGVLGVIGSVQCAAVPPKSGARGFILASLVLDCLALPIPLVTQVADFGPLVGFLLAVTEGLLGLVSWVLFMLFLRKVAYHLDADEAGDEAMHLIVKGLLLLVGIPLGVIAGAFIALLTCMRGFGAFLVAIVLLGIVFINFLFEVLALIGRVRAAIRPPESAGTA